MICPICKRGGGLWLSSIVVNNTSGTFSPNSNVLDKKQHFRIIFRIILMIRDERQKDIKYEENPTLEFVKWGFWCTSFYYLVFNS